MSDTSTCNFAFGRLLFQATPCAMNVFEKFLGMKLYVCTLVMNRGVDLLSLYSITHNMKIVMFKWRLSSTNS